MKYIPYTYLIGWSHLDKWYYGAKYGQDANPSTFWINYHTSSNIVKEYRLKYDEPDVIQIRKTFETADEAIIWEDKVLTRLNAPFHSKMLNGATNHFHGITGPFTEEHKANIGLACQGRKHTPEHKEKISKSLKGKKKPPRSEEHRKNMSEAKTGFKHTDETIAKMKLRPSSFKGKKHTEASKEKIRVSLTGFKHTDEAKAKIGAASKGRVLGKQSEQHKANLSAANKGKKKPTTQCPHCHKVGGVSQMKQWHFDNCKQIAS